MDTAAVHAVPINFLSWYFRKEDTFEVKPLDGAAVRFALDPRKLELLVSF